MIAEHRHAGALLTATPRVLGTVRPARGISATSARQPGQLKHALFSEDEIHQEMLIRCHGMEEFRFQINERNTRRRQMSRPLGRNLLCVPNVF